MLSLLEHQRLKFLQCQCHGTGNIPGFSPCLRAETAYFKLFLSPLTCSTVDDCEILDPDFE